MKIALLGWGSLLWDSKFVKKWYDDGPVLPLEFSRISKDGRLTLVIDEKNGSPNSVKYSFFKTKDVDEAVSILVKREKMENAKNIGIMKCAEFVGNEALHKFQPEILNSVAHWGLEKDIDYVVFTALGRKFKDKIGIDYSVPNAIKYLSRIPNNTRDNALKYIKRIHPSIKTPFKLWLENVVLNNF